jgi:hypothetical protein
MLHSLLHLLVTTNLVPSSLILFTIIIEAIRSTETSVFIRATRRNFPDNGILKYNFVSGYLFFFYFRMLSFRLIWLHPVLSSRLGICFLELRNTTRNFNPRRDLRPNRLGQICNAWPFGDLYLRINVRIIAQNPNEVVGV